MTFEDPHSFARPSQVRVSHIGLRWDVSFDRRRLDGEAVLLLERSRRDAPLRLDTRELEISKVEVGYASIEEGPRGTFELVITELSTAWTETAFRLGEPDPHLGSSLEIDLASDTNLVRIHYRTSPSASGLQWLEPAQTAGGVHPFLYSQSQAIHARSWIPCQDTPGSRVTFDAEVQVPSPLRAVMGAQGLDTEPLVGEEGRHRFRFIMPQAVPAYLLALGVGDLACQSLGPRSAVWADPAILPLAASEFGELEHMITAAEKIYGPYRWGHYAVLVLPPAFPFGGMENPRLTFVTPTILAGDRSLISLVAHELAHSWSGNLVTNATWSDFWLNEGFTVYAERRIVELLYGRERAEMEAMLGRQSLQRELAEELAASPEDQHLQVDLRGRDPDDNMNAVPYEKGALFLRSLEEAYGREAFDPFLRKWFDEYSFSSVSTEQFESFLRRELMGESPTNGEMPDPDRWIHGAGIPSGAASPSSQIFSQIDQMISRWLTGKIPTAQLPVTTWTPHEWLHFLRALPEELPSERMVELDRAFALTESGNCEILDLWLTLSIRHQYDPGCRRAEGFLLEVGRRKLLTPLYKELLKTEAGKERAREIYRRARPRYHAITRRTLDALVGI